MHRSLMTIQALTFCESFPQISQTGSVDKIKSLCIFLLRKKKLTYSLTRTYVFISKTSSKFLKCKISFFIKVVFLGLSPEFKSLKKFYAGSIH